MQNRLLFTYLKLSPKCFNCDSTMYHFYHPAFAFAMQHYLPRKLVSRPYVHNPAPIPISQDSTFSKLQFNLRTVKREEEEERETRRERERVGDGGPSEEREKKTHQRG